MTGVSAEQLRAHIAKTRGEMDQLEAALPAIEALERAGHQVAVDVVPAPRRTPAAAPAPSKGKSKTQPNLDDAEVLEVLWRLKRPAKASEICDRLPGADKADVVAALRQMAAAKKVVKSGATISLRYAAPEFAQVTFAE